MSDSPGNDRRRPSHRRRALIAIPIAVLLLAAHIGWTPLWPPDQPSARPSSARPACPSAPGGRPQMASRTSSRLTTRLGAEIATRAPGDEYANGDRGVTVEVTYEGKPFDTNQFTLTTDEAHELAGQLDAQAKELRRA